MIRLLIFLIVSTLGVGPACAGEALDEINRAAAAEAAAEEAAWIKRNNAELAAAMNAMFAGKLVRKSWTCSTKPDETTGCDDAEYQGASWWGRDEENPRAVRFEVSPDGGKILFFESEGGAPYAGTPEGPDPDQIKWTDAAGQARTIRFWTGEAGETMYQISDSPVHRSFPGFDPVARFQYSKYQAT